MKKIYIRAFIVGLIGSLFLAITIFSIPLMHATDDAIAWNVTLRIRETSGTENIVVFGEKPDALNDLDQYDLPEPPAPPQLPYIRSWFDTSFSVPFNNLLQEYKSSSSNQAVWNLSLIWMAAPGNLSNTTVNILWDPAFGNDNVTHSLLLYENNMMIVDMLKENSYSFSANGSVHRFQIISHSESPNNNEKSTDFSILPWVIGAVICIVLITTSLILFKRKKN
jgi:hypothetical protein